MRKTLTYASLSLKRALRYAPFVFLITLVLSICIVVALNGLTAEKDSEAADTKLKVGLVGDISDTYFGFGLSAIQSFDSSRYTMEIVEMEEEEAKNALAASELAGYILVPEGFVDDAISGDVGRLTFVTSENGLDVVTLFKKEILDFVASILVESQNGVYAMEDIILEHRFEYSNRGDHINTLMAEYFTLIFGRENVSTTSVIGISDSISTGGYTASAVVVLMLLLTGISCAPIFVHRSLALQELLSSRRCGATRQILCEYAAFFCVMLICFALMLASVGIFGGNLFSLVSEFDGKSTADLIGIAVKFIPAFIAVTAMQFLLFEISDSIVSGVLLQFLASVGLGYVSGCFYPINFFPESIRAIARVVPPGVSRTYLASLISGNPNKIALVMLCVSTVVMLAVCAIVRQRRLNRL